MLDFFIHVDLPTIKLSLNRPHAGDQILYELCAISNEYYQLEFYNI